ncbi:hypothetical protein IWX90DRAFT_487968 [Phyllosticta citrichinensis]|uniref:Uncharacterized protein n=1 Tax=Phyllosticta citrichinensis TaxID=1130410 RepID=A0ABR1XMY1_9PEZI
MDQILQAILFPGRLLFDGIWVVQTVWSFLSPEEVESPSSCVPRTYLTVLKPDGSNETRRMPDAEICQAKMGALLQNAVENAKAQPLEGLSRFAFVALPLFLFVLLFVIPRRQVILAFLAFLGRKALDQLCLLPGRLFSVCVWAVKTAPEAVWYVCVRTGFVTLRTAPPSYVTVLRADGTNELVQMQSAFE